MNCLPEELVSACLHGLPEELVSVCFTFFHSANVLSTAMLASKDWYRRGAHILHSTVVLKLVPGLTMASGETVVSFMKRMVSPLSTAYCIHHLTLSGFASLDLQELVLNILHRATSLRSLNMHNLKLLSGGLFLSPEIFSSRDFLPNLSALNMVSAPFSVSLTCTRPMSALKVHEPMGDALFRRLLSPKSGLSAHINCLDLALSADSPAAAVDLTASLASALAHAPLHALALQFVLDRPRLLSWIEFSEAVEAMGPSLQTLQNLKTLSLVIRPDPIIPAITDGQSGTGEAHRETVTQLLAEKLIRDRFPRLNRIELRWHGWVVEDRQLVPLPRTELLRLPHRWVFTDLNGGYP